MPANLTPQYKKAEEKHRQAKTDEDKLETLREMLRTIPKHKGTEKMQGDIKRRISQLRKAEAKTGSGKRPDPFNIPKSGAGQVVLAGPPNVGKSALVAATTKAQVKVGNYPFTTAAPAPGMWQYEDVQIQLIDTPPMVADQPLGNLLSLVRSADAICIVVDAADEPLEQAETILNLLSAGRLALRSVPRGELDADQAGHRSGIIAANKADVAPPENISALRELYAGKLEVWPVSATSGQGLDALRRRLWELLSVMRVYTKKPGRPADRAKPFTLSVGSTVQELARQIHRELPGKMKYARIWGEGRFDGQHVHQGEPLHDKDILEIHE